MNAAVATRATSRETSTTMMIVPSARISRVSLFGYARVCYFLSNLSTV